MDQSDQRPPETTVGVDPGGLDAWLLDGAGGARSLAPAELDAWTPDAGRIWLDCLRDDQAAIDWLRRQGGLEPLVLDALLAEETRPRWAIHGQGLLVILRGVNLNPGADPEDMVSLRLWLEPGRIYSVHVRPVRAVRDVRAALAEGRGPAGARELLVALVERLVAGVAPVIEDLDDQASALEDALLGGKDESAILAGLAALRRTAIHLRRYLAPQREVLADLANGEADRFLDPARRRLNELAERTAHYVGVLDATREHAAVTQDELQTRAIHRTGRTTHLLTVVAAVFLPMSFVTGLLGMNVGGIPGAGAGWGFVAVCAALLALGAVELWLLRRLRWL